ncbi:MAG: FtsB family cell division protein [Nitrospiraceae bacterium]
MTRQNRKHHSVKRRRRLSWTLVLVAGCVLATVLMTSLFYDEMGVRRYVAMLQHARLLDKEIRDLERQNAELRTDIHRIQHDSARIEELARERLGYVKKGDTVYQIVTDSENRDKVK